LIIIIEERGPHWAKHASNCFCLKGVDYATRMNLYNLIFEMVILDVTVSASATRASFFLIDRVRNQCLVGFPANVGLEPGVNDEAPIITVSRASPSRRAARSRLVVVQIQLYEFVLCNLYKKCTECTNLQYNLYNSTNCTNLYYTICITRYELYEFVCMNLYKN